MTRAPLSTVRKLHQYNLLLSARGWVTLTYEESADADAASAWRELARFLHQCVLHGVVPVYPCRSRDVVSKLNIR